ncbi:MAG: hypothetical protein KIT34_09395 [Cyanobacteria bacterium TGS_CYA1]|nr:hypothetical protein [Cyanobacteria bacterium TGS_CYA1]
MTNSIRRLLFSFLALLILQLQMPPYVEAAITSVDGKPQGQANLNKVGSLLLADGVAILTETTLTINATQNGQTQTVLQGNVFKTNVSSSGNVTGFVQFNGGTMLSRLQQNTHERVSRTDGTKQSIQITSVSPQVIETKNSDIPVPQVNHVHSPHVYTFEISAGEEPKCILRPTCHCLLRKRFVMALIMVGLVCAITLPIVIPLAAGGGGNNNQWWRNNGASPGVAGSGGYLAPGVVSPAAAGGAPASSGGGGGGGPGA